MKYYKLLDENNISPYSGFTWDISGEWMKVKGDLKICENGFHVLRAEDILYWIHCGLNLYEVEIGPDKIVEKNKICVRSVRVIRKIESYNKENVLEFVIKPAVKRAQKYADASSAYAKINDYAALDAKYAALDAEQAIRTCNDPFTSANHNDYGYAMAYAKDVAKSSIGLASERAIDAAEAFAVAKASESDDLDDVDYAAVERKAQTADIKKILNMEVLK